MIQFPLAIRRFRRHFTDLAAIAFISIAFAPGVDRRTVQRWLVAGGEPEHSRPSVSGCQIGQQLWRKPRAILEVG
ncbi:hypothetical protein [Bradyrhizobium neotropicale]|uniref:hypothetical protein n=1 Tax=Bradyrhizobium neotropicale TaxID=1497615 RepID=UPI001FEFD0B6|nr:hypothetical protein [Bradyrhizobium neotropicale]